VLQKSNGSFAVRRSSRFLCASGYDRPWPTEKPVVLVGILARGNRATKNFDIGFQCQGELYGLAALSAIARSPSPHPPLAMFKLLRRLISDESGPTAVEYAVMLALIVGVCITSVNVLAHATGDCFNTSSGQLSGVLGP
jgi:pilus assembly protein Flp/PilA